MGESAPWTRISLRVSWLATAINSCFHFKEETDVEKWLSPYRAHHVVVRVPGNLDTGRHDRQRFGHDHGSKRPSAWRRECHGALTVAVPNLNDRTQWFLLGTQPVT